MQQLLAFHLVYIELSYVRKKRRRKNNNNSSSGTIRRYYWHLLELVHSEWRGLFKGVAILVVVGLKGDSPLGRAANICY